MTRFIWPALLNLSLGRSAKLKQRGRQTLKGKELRLLKKNEIIAAQNPVALGIGGGANYIFVSLWKKKP